MPAPESELARDRRNRGRLVSVCGLVFSLAEEASDSRIDDRRRHGTDLREARIIEERAAFPERRHDNQVDAMTQALLLWNLVPNRL